MRSLRLLSAALVLPALAVPAHAGLFRHRRAVAYPSSPCAGVQCPAPAPQPQATPLYHPVLYRPMPAGTPYVGEDGPPVRPSPQSGPTGGLPEPEPAHHRRHHGR
jgi:hypothetical protein